TFTTATMFTVSKSDGDGSGGGVLDPDACKKGGLLGVDPTEITLAVGEKTGSFSVKAGKGCSWLALEYVGPVAITSAGRGVGPGTVAFQVQPPVFGGSQSPIAVIEVHFYLGPNAPDAKAAVVIHLPP